MRSHSVGPKIYMRDSSSFFSWNRRLGSNLQAKKYISSDEVEPQNIPNVRPATSLLLAARAGGNVGKGIKNVQRQDASQFTQDQRAKAISKVNLTEDNNKTYDNSFVKSKLAKSRNAGTVAPAKKALRGHCVGCSHG